MPVSVNSRTFIGIDFIIMRETEAWIESVAAAAAAKGIDDKL